MAQGDLDGVLAAAAAIRAAGNQEFYYLAASYDWRFLEVEALILLGRLDGAGAALAGIQARLADFGPPAARLTAARLRAEVSLAAGQLPSAVAAVGHAWRHAPSLASPLPLAQLEITDARVLDETGQPAAAAARLASARRRLARLGATPGPRADGRLAMLPLRTGREKRFEASGGLPRRPLQSLPSSLYASRMVSAPICPVLPMRGTYKEPWAGSGYASTVPAPQASTSVRIDRKAHYKPRVHPATLRSARFSRRAIRMSSDVNSRNSRCSRRVAKAGSRPAGGPLG